jgi:hypothetical protein
MSAVWEGFRFHTKMGCVTKLGFAKMLPEYYSALHFILQSQFSKNLQNVPFLWVLVCFCVDLSAASFICYLVWNNTCENGVFKKNSIDATAE